MWLIEPFNKARHDRSHFDCGNILLNRFLREQVSPHTRKGISRSYVAVERTEEVANKPVLGYYTLSAGSITFEDLPDQLRKQLPKHPLPIVLIGRLAIHVDHQGRGFGGVLLFDVLKRAEKISYELGIAAIGVEAKDEQAAGFYRHHGFKPLLGDPAKLILPTATVRQLIS